MKDRKIALDTETTGLNYLNGDRVIEICAIELFNNKELGSTFHYYLNPEKEIHQDAIKVHGITNDFLKDKPKFSDVVDQFLDFIQDSQIIAHNADFDRNFLNLELSILKKNLIKNYKFIDTLKIARQKFKGEKVSLDHLCDKFNISLAKREQYHSALVDTELLAKVYGYLMNDIQDEFSVLETNKNKELKNSADLKKLYQAINSRNLVNISDNIQHQEFIKQKIKNPIWK